MKPANTILSVVLLVSAAVGSYILATDSYLWAVAPTHAYGLGAFTIIDLALIVGLRKMPRTAIIITVLLGLVQLGAMSGDVFFGTSTFSSNGATAAAFSKYLLGDGAFVTLLGAQAVLIVVGIAAFVMSRARTRRTDAVMRIYEGFEKSEKKYMTKPIEHHPNMTTPIKIGRLSELPPGQMKGYVVNEKRIVVVNIDGKLFAISSVCTHAGGPLEKGKLDGSVVTCPWHGSKFDVTNGKVVGGPASSPESTYLVKVEGEDIMIEA